jgi:hypothetical protein
MLSDWITDRLLTSKMAAIYGPHLGFGFHWFSDQCLAWVDWSNFLVAHWGWLEEGSFPWPTPPLIQHGRYSSHLGFGFHQLPDECLRQLVRFFGGSLGIINLHHIPLLPKPYLPCPQTTSQSGAYATRCVAIELIPKLLSWNLYIPEIISSSDIKTTKRNLIEL